MYLPIILMIYKVACSLINTPWFSQLAGASIWGVANRQSTCWNRSNISSVAPARGHFILSHGRWGGRGQQWEHWAVQRCIAEALSLFSLQTVKKSKSSPLPGCRVWSCHPPGTRSRGAAGGHKAQVLKRSVGAEPQRAPPAERAGSRRDVREGAGPRRWRQIENMAPERLRSRALSAFKLRGLLLRGWVGLTVYPAGGDGRCRAATRRSGQAAAPPRAERGRDLNWKARSLWHDPEAAAFPGSRDVRAEFIVNSRWGQALGFGPNWARPAASCLVAVI
jgi:hypothetical protein